MTKSLSELDLKSLLELVANTLPNPKPNENDIFGTYNDALLNHKKNKNPTPQDTSIIDVALKFTRLVWLYKWTDKRRKTELDGFYSDVKRVDDYMNEKFHKLIELQTALRQMINQR